MGIRRARVRMSAVGTGLVVAATVLGGLMPLPATSAPPGATAALAPGQQLLLGAVPQGAGNTRWTGVTDLESTIGRPLDFVRVFELWDSAYPTTFHSQLTSSDRIMAISIRARRTNGTTIPWADIATMQPGSALYNQLQTWITRMMAIGKPVWFTFNHEPEIAANQVNGTDADYIAAWRRVVTEFRARGATNVAFNWIVTGYGFELPSTDRRYAPKWYPGDDYVDYLSTDTYNWSTCRPGVFNPWRDFSSVPAGLKAFGALHPDKRLILTEWASAEQGGDKAAWIDDARELFKQPGYEQFLGISYFNKIDGTFPQCQWPIDSSPAATAAFVRLAQDPFFGGPGGASPPSVTVTAPAEGATVDGTTPLTAITSDGSATVTSVSFRVATTTVGTDTDATDGWSVPWDSTSVADGTVTVTATATDADGLSGTDTSTFSVRNHPPSAVYLVTATPASLPAGEAAVRSRLLGLGYDVRVVDDDTVTASGVADASLVIIGTSVTRTSAASNLTAIPATVWVAKPYLFDELSMTAAPTTNYGSVATTTVDVTAPANPMAAGRTGTVTFLTARDAVSWGTPGAGATTVATVGGRATMFVYPRGSTLVGGATAPGCRLTFPLYGTAPTRHTAAAWAMFDATTAYAVTGC
ncbi:MAG: Ig-like domain-containing protein [Nocardioidaceae bacterium]